MNNINFTKLGRFSFFYSFIGGTLLFLLYCATMYHPLMIAGFYYVIIAEIVNFIVFFHELIYYITDVSENKSHGNSALLVLVNIPVAILYLAIIVGFF